MSPQERAELAVLVDESYAEYELELLGVEHDDEDEDEEEEEDNA